MIRKFLSPFVLYLIAASALVIALPVMAQDVTTSDVTGALGALWPGLSKYVALLVPLQVFAKLLAPLPGRIGGYTHGTIWSRFWDTVAAFPAAPASRPAFDPSKDVAGNVIGGG